MDAANVRLHDDLEALRGQTLMTRYRVDSVLGIGGMGAVFRAHHLGLHRDVAVKVLHPDLSRDEQISGRFDREARSASRLDHPNCMRVTDYGSTETDMKFMVMELLEGSELDARLGSAVSAEQAVQWGEQIAAALEHAHGHGVIHRDLKPANVFITTDHEGKEVLKLVDFGIAKIIGGEEGGEGQQLTRTGLVFGTPEYMSPEQATGLDIDARSDLYALGIILYQMVTGAVPFTGGDPVTLLRKQVTNDPPPLPANLPQALRALIRELLAKERDRRPKTATVVRERLSRMHGSHAEPPLLAHTRRALEIARARPGVLAAAASALIGLGLWAAVSPNESPREALAEQPLSLATEIPAAAEVPPKELTELDRLIDAKRWRDADRYLQPLLDSHPASGLLHWRAARIHRSRHRNDDALRAYGRAAELDTALLDDPAFWSELEALMKERKLRTEAIDLAMRKLGPRGHEFLFELLRDEAATLTYVDRHRILDEFASEPERLKAFDLDQSARLDLRQAKYAAKPCAAYGEALEHVRTHPSRAFIRSLRRYEPPTAPRQADSKERATCDQLPERRDAILATLEAIPPDDSVDEAADDGDEDAAEDSSPEAAKPSTKRGAASTGSAKKSKKRRRSASRKPSKCNQFGAVLRYKECR